MVWTVNDVKYKQEKLHGAKKKVAITKVHRTYERAIAKHNGYLGKLVALKKASGV